MLIFFLTSPILAQEEQVVMDSTLDQPIRYFAKDSIVQLLQENKTLLYGNARVEFDDIELTAGYIAIDMQSKLIEASYIFDKDSNRIELPVFKQGGQEMVCQKIKYNTETKKGFIEELALKQEELTFRMEIAKKQENNELHLKHGKFSTCDLENPHYHFQLSKGVIVPDERIVTGPLNLHVNGIPTPLGLPFAIIPTKSKERVKGLLFPEFVPISQYGFGLQNLGYYIPINDRMQTTLYANIYNRGSWGLRNELDYASRYQFRGKLNLGWQQFFRSFPIKSTQNKISITWSHRTDAKASPYSSFSSNVNFVSDNTQQNSLDPINEDYFSNSFNSDINYSAKIPNSPLNIGVKVSLRQNSIAKTIALNSPVVNANMSRVFPFKNLLPKNKSPWMQAIHKIGLTYNLEGINRSSFKDSLLTSGDFNAIGNLFMNGLSQNSTLQTNIGLFKNTVKINPSINYGNKINFQQITKSYDQVNNTTLVDTLRQAGMAHEMNLNISATTVVYNYYEFFGKSKPKIRHLITPTIGFRYVPKLNPLISDSVGIDQALIAYSRYERSVYQVGNSVGASLLNFGFNNTFEMKYKSSKDTLTGYKKIRLIDQFSVLGNYDFRKDSMQLSNITMNLRISPLSWMNFVSNASFSPYSSDSTGKSTAQIALLNNDGLGRFLTLNLTIGIVLANKKSRKKIKETSTKLNDNWNSAYEYFSLHPNEIIYFDIPWKMNISHIYSINANQNISLTNLNKYNSIQTLSFSGDVSFSKTWNLSGRLNYNLESLSITNAYFTLNRNLHCWALSFYWVPIGGNKSFLLSIRNTSNLLRDAKFDFRKPPVFL